jgi:hypothetical protein
VSRGGVGVCRVSQGRLGLPPMAGLYGLLETTMFRTVAVALAAVAALQSARPRRLVSTCLVGDAVSRTHRRATPLLSDVCDRLVFAWSLGDLEVAFL